MRVGVFYAEIGVLNSGIVYVGVNSVLRVLLRRLGVVGFPAIFPIQHRRVRLDDRPPQPRVLAGHAKLFPCSAVPGDNVRILFQMDAVTGGNLQC